MRLLVLLLSACVPENSPVMQPGEQCISCHDLPDNSHQWTSAGTVFPAADSDTADGIDGVRVFIEDARGKTFTLFSNSAGNFYTAEALAFPISVEVERNGVRVTMQTKPEHGDCNRCHTQPPTDDAPGRIYVPE